MEAAKLKTTDLKTKEEILAHFPTKEKISRNHIFAFLDTYHCKKEDGDWSHERLGADLRYTRAHHTMFTTILRMQNWKKPIFAIDQKNCFPKVETLAIATKTSERWTEKIISDLEEARLIRRLPGSRKDSNYYQITPVIYWEYCLHKIAKLYNLELDESNHEVFQDLANLFTNEKFKAIESEKNFANPKLKTRKVIGLKGTVVKKIKALENEIATNGPTQEALNEKSKLEQQLEEITLEINKIKIQKKALKGKKKSLIFNQKQSAANTEDSAVVTADSAANPANSAAKTSLITPLKTDIYNSLSKSEDLTKRSSFCRLENVLKRCEKLPHLETLTEAKIAEFEAQISIKGDEGKIQERIEANLNLWESSDVLKLPPLDRDKHSLKRLLTEDLEGNVKRQHSAVIAKIREYQASNRHLSHHELIEYFAKCLGYKSEVLLKIYPGYQAPKLSEEKTEDSSKIREIHREITELLDADELSYFTRQVSHTLTTTAKAEAYLLDLRRHKTAAKKQINPEPAKPAQSKSEVIRSDSCSKQADACSKDCQSNPKHKVDQSDSDAKKHHIELVEPLTANTKPVAPKKHDSQAEAYQLPRRGMSAAVSQALKLAGKKDEPKKSQTNEPSKSAKPVQPIARPCPSSELRRVEKSNIENQNPIATVPRGGTGGSLFGGKAKPKQTQKNRSITDSAAWFAYQGKYAGDPKYLDFVQNVFPNIRV